jgi:predicted NAD-dependent protein-ADP-ribosyltransferase YbiA (DUF1768 family)
MAKGQQFRGEKHFFIEPNGKNNEARFQAPKTLDEEARRIILAASPREAKRLGSPRGFRELSERLGRPISLREDWDALCREVMYWSLGVKFQDPTLRAKLLATGDDYLEEANTWCDTRWGVCYCPKHKGDGEGTGTNWLGLELMKLRDELGAAGPG